MNESLIHHPDHKARCWWPGSEPLYVEYHDTEWGVPEYDDRALFEKLILDGFQAGISWITILRKRDNFRKAFANFDPAIIARFDEALRPHDLTFARYEVLVLLTFSRTGELPLKVIGSRLMVHPTSVTNAIDRLAAAGYVERRPNPADGRGVLARITDAGRAVVEQATTALTGMDFGLSDVPSDELTTLFGILRRVRLGAGDVADAKSSPSVDER